MPDAPILLQPLGREGATSGLPVGPVFQVWQPVDRPDPYTCSQCGQTQTGLRFLELQGDERHRGHPLLSRPWQIAALSRQATRRVLCPACRGAKPATPERPKRRKTQLD